MSTTAGAARGTRSTSAALSLVRAHAWTIAVWAAMAGWTAILYLIVREAFLEFRLGRFDLGNMVQAVWSTTEGRPLETTHGSTGEQMTRLGSHVDPFLALLAPLWMLWPSPLTLAAVQIAAVSAGALPVFWLARRHLESERLAALLALAYLVYPWTAWSAVDAFHPVTLAIPLFLFGVWFLDADRLGPFAVCAMLAAATGELMGLVVAALGVWYALARGRRRAGTAIAAAGIGWTLFALLAVVPAFSGGSSVFYGIYEEVGGSPWGVVQTAVTDPGTILSAVSRGSDLLYLFLLSAPLAGGFLLAPALAAVAVPQLAANLLAGVGATTDPHEQYVAGILPFLFAATAIGLARLSPPGRARGVALIAVLSLAATATVGPWPRTLLGAESWELPAPSRERVRALDRAVAQVPDNAPVSSTNRVGSHLADRRYLYSVPVVGRAEWIVVDSTDDWIPDHAGGHNDPYVLRAFLERIERSARWRNVFERDGVFVYRRAQT